MRFGAVFAALILVLTLATCSETPLPVIIWHGMGDSGYNDGMKKLARLVETNLPGVKTKLITTGKDFLEDFEAGYFGQAMEQIEQVCQEIRSDPTFDQGAQFLGLSQGGIFARAFVQVCPLKGQLGSLISLGGPQQGVYGVPMCPGGVSDLICRLMDKLLTHEAYTDFMQKHLIQAQYWHDPLARAQYKNASKFLALVNQENAINASYVENIKRLRNFVMVMFADDTIVVPRESEFFGYFAENNLKSILPLEETALFQEDRLGLKSLSDQGRLHRITVPGNHLQFNSTWFVNEIILKFLAN